MLKFWIEIHGVMSTFKLSGRRGIKNWRVSTNISFHFEKHGLSARQYRRRCNVASSRGTCVIVSNVTLLKLE